MKITKAQFKQIVSEELKTILERNRTSAEWAQRQLDRWQDVSTGRTPGEGATSAADRGFFPGKTTRLGTPYVDPWQKDNWPQQKREYQSALQVHRNTIGRINAERDKEMVSYVLRGRGEEPPGFENLHPWEQPDAMRAAHPEAWAEAEEMYGELDYDDQQALDAATARVAEFEQILADAAAADAASEEEQRKIQGINEEKTHTMKLNYEKLARLVKEELEVILTDEEANEMFGLKNMVQDKKLKEDCGGAHKRDDEEDDEPSPDKGGPSGTSAKKDTRPDSELRRDVKEAQLHEADVVYIAKMLLNGLLALHKAGVTPTAIIDALSGAGERERGAMVGLPGFEELPPEVQGAVGGNVAQHDQARGLAMEEGGSQYTIPPGGFGGRSHGKGSCEGECNNSQNYHQCLEDCKERKRAEQGRSSAKLDKRIGLGQWEEGKVTMSRKGLTDMIREEMARLVIIKP
jgi:hypothetical protein